MLFLVEHLDYVCRVFIYFISLESVCINHSIFIVSIFLVIYIVLQMFS